jgi:serine/threonine-protein kinase
MFVCSECGGPQPVDGQCPSDGTRLAPIGEDILLGTTIGAYRVARLLGIGGMGRVYKGVHPTIGSRVAIKVLSRECSDRRDLVDRFFAEAKAVNLIRHESIVNVLDLAMLPDGRPYIIMEYLDGAPLASIIEHSVQNRTPLPLGGLARLTVEVLDALAAAHAKGIVHRDLKPDNIFVGPSGRPKVLDFGIAKLNDPGSGGGSTRTGSLLGTPHYMAPEQAAGRPVDYRADIYAIGVILFECATGQKPFMAESLFDLLRKHVEEAPPSPRLYRPDMDPGLEQLILCALAKAPDQRFGSAQAMSMALQNATAKLPPEQWTPITGSGTHRAVPSGGWQPTPPASWGGSRAAPRPSEQPIDRIANLSTVSASSGQVQVPRKTKEPASRKGLWITLLAIVLIGGGITVGVVAGGGGNGDSTTVAADQPQPPPPDKAAPTPAAPAPAPTAKPADKNAPDEDTDADEAEAIADIKQATKNLPPDVKKQIDDAIGTDAAKRVEELRKINKLPVAERAKALDKLGKAPKTAPAAKVVTDVEDDTPPSKAPAKTDWIESRALAMPGGWNPKHVDVGAFVKFALAQAKQAMPDAQLTRIGVNGVTPDGFANLELPTLASKHGDIELRFISPSHSKPDPKTPIGVPVELQCEFRIMGEPDGIEIRSMFKSKCKERTIPPPKCSAAGLWKLAIAKQAPSGNAVASISYYQASMHNTPRFFFDIGFAGDMAFSQVFTPDQCP